MPSLRRGCLLASGMTVALLVYLLYSLLPSPSTGSVYSAASNGPVHVLITFTKAASQPALQAKLNETLRSLLRHASPPMDVRIIGDFPSRRIARELFDAAPRSAEFVLLDEDMERVEREVTRRLGPLIDYFRSSKKNYYGQSLFFLSLVAHRLFPRLDKVVLLDCDLSFRDDVRHLWDEFGRFRRSNLVGIAREAQPVYRHVFASFREKNPGTRVGDPPPKGLTGFNSGVLLLHLARMRDSPKYESLLEVEFVKLLAERYGFRGHLGDQDLYTLLSVDMGGLFHVLDCSWNRQLCRWWETHGYEGVFEEYFRCEGPVRIYHGNCNTPIPPEDQLLLN